MAMVINPIDGLVQRLIRQGAGHSSTVRQVAFPGRDRVSFSHEARQAGLDAPSSKLESQLLQSYGPHKNRP